MFRILTILVVLIVVIFVVALFYLDMNFLVSIGLVYVTAVASQPISDNDSLRLISVFLRHGARTPEFKDTYPNDPYKLDTFQPMGWGQLTNAGKRKEYNIGKELRTRYIDFLGDEEFTLDTVDARCTDYNRTKMSLQLVLASLFPPRGDLVWENQLDWQPVPFNYWPIHEDHVLADPLQNCPRYNKLFWKYLNSTEGKMLFENHTDLIKYLEHHTGSPMYSKAFADLYFSLTTEKENGYDHPEWAKSVYQQILQLAINDYNVSSATDELKKYVVGFLVKKIIDDSYTKIKGEYYKGTKIFLYSAHEFNIAVLLRYLDVFYPHVPPYGSYVIIELHNYGTVRGFKFFYQDYTEDGPKHLNIPGCGGHFCKLTRFVRLFQHMLPESDRECFNVAGL
ncbi:venom acid phosphatase Acph-1 isoform X2 [Dendroctonus ponderosae]|uniref:venom acid phosphatase Acph-1 isoform X2 n=1 Tax=Dendroctonus ponderosae TaxID=77166 RepID=UPI0020361E8D|nr:venom acid phosphatase Acph-1 isoform X2 [Dendroctonus ponderosae]